MSRAGLFLVPGLLSCVLLLTGACVNQEALTPTPDTKITVRQSGGAGILRIECQDRDYISDIADYIIEGTVIKVESKWDEDRTSIFTYSSLSIEKYVKGSPLGESKLQIVTPGGTVGDISQWVEDQPIFHEGKRVRIYLQENNGELSIVCAQFGVEENRARLPIPSQLSNLMCCTLINYGCYNQWLVYKRR